MAVVISEIVTEVVVGGTGSAEGPAASANQQEMIDSIVRRASERVMETLRREWDR